MTQKEKAELIDFFLKSLVDSGSPRSLASILEQNKPTSKDNRNHFKLLEYELEKHDLVKLVSGGDNSTPNGEGVYMASGKGLDYVMNGKSTIELLDE